MVRENALGWSNIEKEHKENFWLIGIFYILIVVVCKDFICIYIVVWSLSPVQLLWSHVQVVHQAPLSWDFPGKNTGVDCHFLLQGIFPTQGSNPHLLHCREILCGCAAGEALCVYITQTHIYGFGWIRIIKLWWNVHKIWNRNFKLKIGVEFQW